MFFICVQLLPLLNEKGFSFGCCFGSVAPSASYELRAPFRSAGDPNFTQHLVPEWRGGGRLFSCSSLWPCKNKTTSVWLPGQHLRRLRGPQSRTRCDHCSVAVQCGLKQVWATDICTTAPGSRVVAFVDQRLTAVFWCVSIRGRRGRWVHDRLCACDSHKPAAASALSQLTITTTLDAFWIFASLNLRLWLRWLMVVTLVK